MDMCGLDISNRDELWQVVPLKLERPCSLEWRSMAYYKYRDERLNRECVNAFTKCDHETFIYRFFPLTHTLNQTI